MIESGEIRPREPLPSIKTIMQRYEVAKGTAEKALHVLARRQLPLSWSLRWRRVPRHRPLSTTHGGETTAAC